MEMSNVPRHNNGLRGTTYHNASWLWSYTRFLNLVISLVIRQPLQQSQSLTLTVHTSELFDCLGPNRGSRPFIEGSAKDEGSY